MSKKLKGVALDSLPFGGYGDGNRAMLKHQALLQDYQDLQQETNGIKTRLEAAKQRKRMLLADVRFLRKRYKYLATNNSLKRPREQELLPPVSVETQSKLSAKYKVTKNKDANRAKLPPLPNSNHKGRVYVKKQASHGNANASLDQVEHVGKQVTQLNTTRLSDFNHRGRIYSGNEAAVKVAAPVIDLNQTERIYSRNDAGVWNPAQALDLNQDSSLSGKETSLPSRAPSFDLNEILTEEEDTRSYSAAPVKPEELKRSLMRGGSEEQLNDLKLSIVCRNAGEGPSLVGKRKITWQDPVALRV